MKKVILYIIALSLPVALTGCLDNLHKDEIENISRTVTVKLIPPEGFESESFEGTTVQLWNNRRGIVYKAAADANNTATFEVEIGVYSPSCQKPIVVNGKQSMLIGMPSEQNYDITENRDIEMEFTYTYHMGELVIKEICFSGTKNMYGANYMNDQHVILYNNTDRLMYLDDYGVSMSAEINLPASNAWKDDYLDKGWTPLHTFTFVFPTNESGTLYPLEPGEEVVLAYNAIDHTQAAPTSVNLGRSGCFAMYTSSLTNAAVPATEDGVVIMDLLHSGQNLNSIPLSATQASFAVFKIDGTTPQDYITRPGVISQKPGTSNTLRYLCIETQYIVDAVEFTNGSNSTYRFPLEVNGGNAGIFRNTAASYSGVSFQRKVKEVVGERIVYQDTNNTAEDFIQLDAPSLAGN